MSWDFYEHSTPKARKDYRCDACEFINEAINEGYFSFAEMRLIVKAKRNGWKIKKGEIYDKCSGKFDGDFSVFRAIPEMNDLCLKHDLYYE